jgi:hypothetical protein
MKIVMFDKNRNNEAKFQVKRRPRSFGQLSEVSKWNIRGTHAADLIVDLLTAARVTFALNAAECVPRFLSQHDRWLELPL